jgi:flavin-dependent dehydrogenase
VRFLDHGLPGYAWFVPKRGGFCNIGIGGVRDTLVRRGRSIRDHWNAWIARLTRDGVVKQRPWRPDGYIYHTRQSRPALSHTNVYLVGDAVGLATLDMGEGIGPAIESGRLAAKAILTGSAYSIDAIPRHSLLPAPLRVVRDAFRKRPRTA